MITSDMKIADVMRNHPQTIQVFSTFGLDCNACQIAEYEEIEHGAAVHNVDLEGLMAELNRVVGT